MSQKAPKGLKETSLPHPDFRPGIWNKGEVPAWVKEVKDAAKAAGSDAPEAPVEPVVTKADAKAAKEVK